MSASTDRRPSGSGEDQQRIAWIMLALAGIALLTLVTLTACAPKAGPNDVFVKDLRFNPKKLTVSAGTTVTWTNFDQTAHTITSDSNDTTDAPKAQKFTSKPLSPGDTYKHTFDTPGTYKYHCSIHPYLTGEVIVK